MDGFFWDFFTASLLIMLYGTIIFLWGMILWDMFSRRDLSGVAKGFWLLAIIFLPVFGSLIYLIVRPRDANWFGHSDEPVIYSARDAQMAEVETLVRMRDQGTITDAEFTQMKGRVLREEPVGGFPPPSPA